MNHVIGTNGSKLLTEVVVRLPTLAQQDTGQGEGVMIWLVGVYNRAANESRPRNKLT